MWKRFYALAALLAIAFTVQLIASATFAGGHGDCDCPNWYFWKHPKGPFGRDQICDTPCGTPFSCPPQGGYYGYFPTCWSRWPQDWQNCPVTDAAPIGMAPCNAIPSEAIPQSTIGEEVPAPISPPLAPPASSRRIYMRQKSASVSPDATQIPSTAAIEKISSETIRAASQTFITPAAAKPHLASAAALAEDEGDSAPPERLDVAYYDAATAAVPTKVSQRAASKPAVAQRHQQPIRWEVLEADLAARSKTAIDTSSKLADVQSSRRAFVEDAPLKLRPNPVREPRLTAINRSGAKNESQQRTHFHAVRPAQAQLPVKAEAVNPLRLGASSKRTDVHVADMNPLRR